MPRPPLAVRPHPGKAMALTVSCPQCGLPGPVPDELQGRLVACGRCQALVPPPVQVEVPSPQPGAGQPAGAAPAPATPPSGPVSPPHGQIGTPIPLETGSRAPPPSLILEPLADD